MFRLVFFVVTRSSRHTWNQPTHPASPLLVTFLSQEAKAAHSSGHSVNEQHAACCMLHTCTSNIICIRRSDPASTKIESCQKTIACSCCCLSLLFCICISTNRSTFFFIALRDRRPGSGTANNASAKARSWVKLRGGTISDLIISCSGVGSATHSRAE